MRFLPVVLLLSALCFGDELYTIRADGTGNYLTPQACEDAHSNSLLGRGRVECRETQGATYVGDITWTGQTNQSAADYLAFTGVSGTTYRSTSAATFPFIANSNNYIRFEGIRFEIRNAAQKVALTIGALTGAIIDRCVFAFYLSADGYGVTNNLSTNVTIRNSAFIAYAGAVGTWGIYGGTTTATYQNNTSIGWARAYNASGTITATNCIAIGTTATQFMTVTTQSYNLSSDATATGTGSLINKTFAQVMAADSIHITTASAAYGVGTNLSGSGVLQDIDGQTWTRWSIGADDPTPTATSRPCGGALTRMGIMPRRRCQ